MASSMAITSSILGSTAGLSRLPSAAAGRRSVVVVRASASPEMQKVSVAEEKSSKRRDLVFAAAAAAVCAAAGVAMADEPKNGTAEAKKKYAPVCITMPTARICKN